VATKYSIQTAASKDQAPKGPDELEGRLKKNNDFLFYPPIFHLTFISSPNSIVFRKWK
jgi:hypothetical protein